MRYSQNGKNYDSEKGVHQVSKLANPVDNV